MRTARITRGGQVTFPAAVRNRWGTSVVTVEDHGDHLILRPAPEDPIAAVRGIFRSEGPSSERARREAREEERRSEDRRG